MKLDRKTPVVRTDLASRHTSIVTAGEMQSLLHPPAEASRVLSELALKGEAMTGFSLWMVK